MGDSMSPSGARGAAPALRCRRDRDRHGGRGLPGGRRPARRLRHALPPARPWHREPGADPGRVAHHAKGGPGNHAVLSLAGPLAFVTVIAVWGALVVLGFALILWPHFPEGFAGAGYRGRAPRWPGKRDLSLDGEPHQPRIRRHRPHGGFAALSRAVGDADRPRPADGEHLMDPLPVQGSLRLPLALARDLGTSRR